MGDNPVVLNFHESLLRLSDVELLAGPCWLNDTVISFYFEYLEVRKFKGNPVLLFVPPQVRYVDCSTIDKRRLLDN